jgi:hypothetical protein
VVGEGEEGGRGGRTEGGVEEVMIPS